MSITHRKWIASVEAISQEIEEIIAWHTQDPPLLIHLLLGDLRIHATQLAQRSANGDPRAANELRQLLEILRNVWNRGTAFERNALSVSFLEGLIGATEDAEVHLRAALPPELASDLASMEAWRPEDPAPPWDRERALRVWRSVQRVVQEEWDPLQLKDQPPSIEREEYLTMEYSTYSEELREAVLRGESRSSLIAKLMAFERELGVEPQEARLDAVAISLIAVADSGST